MASEHVERRLAAILVADLVGYSRLVGADEEGTIARLGALREELIDPCIDKHHGRIVKTAGDGLLVGFATALDMWITRCREFSHIPTAQQQPFLTKSDGKPSADIPDVHNRVVIS